MYKTWKKGPAGNISRFFSPGTLKNCILNQKSNPQMTTIWAFFPKLGHFFPFLEKGQGRPSPLWKVAWKPAHISINCVFYHKKSPLAGIQNFSVCVDFRLMAIKIVPKNLLIEFNIKIAKRFKDLRQMFYCQIYQASTHIFQVISLIWLFLLVG